MSADWDMTAYFPGPTSAELSEFRLRWMSDVDSLSARLDGLEPLSASGLTEFAAALVVLEDVQARTAHQGSYLDCLSAADARDEDVKSAVARHAADQVPLDQLMVRVRAMLGAAEASLFDALLGRDEIAPIAYFVRRLRERARHSMEPALEGLAAELAVTGPRAWSRLYDRISGDLEFELVGDDGSSELVPVAMTRTLLEDPSPATRRAAFVGANEAWARVAEPVAAGLNALAGSRLALYARRGIDHFLEPALFDAGITRETLDAMWQVVQDRIEVPRRFLRRKAEALGVDRLGFQDLMAPLPLETDERVPWETGTERVIEAFAGFYPDLARFAERAIADRWVDHSPRAGKRPGGFCSTSKVIGQSRIFMTYNGASGDVATLAHELGHAWHGWLMRDQRPFARRYPMTLAETASTFAENIVVEFQLASARGETLAATLEGRLQDASAYMLNILMRYRFECRFYEERAAGEVPIPRLCALMEESQREVYGDALDEEQLDPWFWASKLHFHLASISFYNFPYTFGYLFSTGLFARALEDPKSFLPEYESLLRATGSAGAEQIARDCLGVDLEAPGFWNASVDWVEAHLPRFEAALA